jgi:hypothetical protein
MSRTSFNANIFICIHVNSKTKIGIPFLPMEAYSARFRKFILINGPRHQSIIIFYKFVFKSNNLVPDLIYTNDWPIGTTSFILKTKCEKYMQDPRCNIHEPYK